MLTDCGQFTAVTLSPVMESAEHAGHRGEQRPGGGLFLWSPQEMVVLDLDCDIGWVNRRLWDAKDLHVMAEVQG